MCGIVGYCGPKADTLLPQFKQSIQAIFHRGPDQQDHYQSKNILLGHTRLSIIDLSEHGRQPFYDKESGLSIVFNGEIYNYKELRHKYLSKCSFIGESDTEVLVKLWALKGSECLTELNGMFAFAIWDPKKQHLFLAKDKIGKKPIYYYHQDNELYWCSELKGLMPILDKSLSINPAAVSDYFHLGFVQGGKSIYREVLQLPPGYHMQFDLQSGRVEQSPYWKWEKKSNELATQSIDSITDQLDRLLNDSVKLRLQSDVPLGAFLSGGIDSSLICSIAQKQLGGSLKTFSIGFDDPNKNEAPHAKAIAEHLKTTHTEYHVTYEDALSLLPQYVNWFDEPFADSSALPTYLLSKLTKEKVTVALSGDGGDESFLGYGAYHWAYRLSQPMVWKVRNIISKGLSYGDLRMQRAAKVFNVPDKYNFYSHILSQEQYMFSKRELAKLCQSGPIYDFPLFLKNANMGAMENQAYGDLHAYLPYDLLVKVDRASMASALEVRCPLLDYRVIDFALNLPESIKFKEGQDKYLLKKVLNKYIPKDLYERPKQGFSVPMVKWLQGPLKEWLEEYTSAESINQHGLLNPIAVNKLKKQFYSGRWIEYQKLWSIAIFNQWYKEKAFK